MEPTGNYPKAVGPQQQQQLGASPNTLIPPELVQAVTLQKVDASRSFLENHYRRLLRGIGPESQSSNAGGGSGGSATTAPTSQTMTNSSATVAASSGQGGEGRRPSPSSSSSTPGGTSSLLRSNSSPQGSPVLNELKRVGPREKPLRSTDFENLKMIGRGAFGEVWICRKIGDPKGTLLAMKRMKKAEMLRKKQVIHVRNERNMLADAAHNNPWVVQLVYSFQDEAHLYVVMEYMPGGDMMSWLIQEETFTVEQAKFYVAEMCCAVNSVHEMGYVHRDMKPDNILLDAQGHIKLSDFGLCKRYKQRPGEEGGGTVDLYLEAESNNNNNTNSVSQSSAPQASTAGGGGGPSGSSSSTLMASASVPEDLKGGGAMYSPRSETEAVGQADGATTNPPPPLRSGSSSPVLNAPHGSKQQPTAAHGAAASPPSSLPQPPTTPPPPTLSHLPELTRRALFDSIVGSPGYIAPEILLRHRYGLSCDWWSIGVIMFEMLYGCPPFYSEDPNVTCHKITNWKQFLTFPSNGGGHHRYPVPDVAVDFMKKLLCDANERLDFAQIKHHKFFAGFDWEKLRSMRAAFHPQLSDPLDTRYFPELDTRQRAADAQHQALLQSLDPRDVIFADFKFVNRGPPS